MTINPLGQAHQAALRGQLEATQGVSIRDLGPAGEGSGGAAGSAAADGSPLDYGLLDISTFQAPFRLA